MEPVSLAVGLVPLAMNIVQMSSAIRGHISDYKSAPAHIQSIVDKTTLIGRVCSRLEVDLKSPNLRHEVSILGQALKTCHTNISAVHEELGKVKTQGQKRSLQYLFKKPDIDKSLFNLDNSIQMLNTCIGMSTWMSIGALTLPGSKLCPEGLTKETTAESVSSSVRDTSTTSAAQPTRPKRSLISKSQSWSHHSTLCTYRATSNATIDEHGLKVQQRSYLIGLPFIGAYFSMAMRYGPLSPLSLVLDSPQFIYEHENSLVYKKMTSCAPSPGSTPQEVARWAETFSVKPNTQLVDIFGYSQSVLGALISWNCPEAFCFLLDRGGRSLGDEQHLKTPRIDLVRKEKTSSTDPMLLYVRMRGPLLSLNEYSRVLGCHHHPDMLHEIFDACQAAFIDRNQLEFFLEETMSCVLEFVLYADTEVLENRSWGQFIAKLLAFGLDIHGRMEHRFPDSPTPLFEILANPRPICDALDCAELWLNMLKYAPLDVDTYLLEEFEILSNSSNLQFPLPEAWLDLSLTKRLEHLFYLVRPEELDTPNEYMYTSDDLHGAIPAFRYSVVLRSLLVYDDGEYSHLNWKRNRLDSNLEWPFHKDTRCAVRPSRAFCSRGLKAAFASYDLFLQLMSSRFERRQEKKWKRLKKKNPIEESRTMPGSWKMEWWEYQGGW